MLGLLHRIFSSHVSVPAKYGSPQGSAIAIYHCSHFHSGSMIIIPLQLEVSEISILLTAILHVTPFIISV